MISNVSSNVPCDYQALKLTAYIDADCTIPDEDRTLAAREELVTMIPYESSLTLYSRTDPYETADCKFLGAEKDVSLVSECNQKGWYRSYFEGINCDVEDFMYDVNYLWNFCKGPDSLGYFNMVETSQNFEEESGMNLGVVGSLLAL